MLLADAISTDAAAATTADAANAATGTAADTGSESTITLGRTIKELVDGNHAALGEYVQEAIVPNLGMACMGLAAVFMGYFVASYISRLISRPICKRVDETFGRFVGKAIFYSIMFGVITSVASKLGADLGGLAAVVAAAGFAVGLAFQGTLSNFAAGVLMIVFRPFKVGDVVNVSGVTGKVNEIDLFTTTLDTPDNRRLIIPNSSISSATIENISFHAHRRVEVIVGVDYDANIDTTRKALQDAADVFVRETIHGEGRGTAIVLSNLGDSAVEWKVRMWVNAGDFWPMQESLTGEVKRQLDAVGIGIPYPQMDVHLNRVDEADSQTPARPRMRPAARRDVGDNSLPYAS